jgi:hypothetical protein
MLKPAPDIAAEFTVTADVPLEVRVNFWVTAVFTVVFPKLRFAALTVSFATGAAVPVPLNVTAVVLPLLELLVIVTFPVIAPVTVGLNCTCSVVA